MTKAKRTSLSTTANKTGVNVRGGGRVRLALNGASPTDSLDPGTLTDTFPAEISFGQTRNCLVELNTKHEVVGELAENWESSAGADLWRFQLRSGVEFHNGKTLTSDDVVYTIKQHLGEGSNHPR